MIIPCPLHLLPPVEFLLFFLEVAHSASSGVLLENMRGHLGFVLLYLETLHYILRFPSDALAALLTKVSSPPSPLPLRLFSLLLRKSSATLCLLIALAIDYIFNYPNDNSFPHQYYSMTFRSRLEGWQALVRRIPPGRNNKFREEKIPRRSWHVSRVGVISREVSFLGVT